MANGRIDGDSGKFFMHCLLGTAYSVLSAVAGGPLLATGNFFTGYRYLPTMGKVSDLTAFSTGQIGSGDIMSLISLDSWSKRAKNLGAAALAGLATAAVSSLLISRVDEGDTERAEIWGYVNQARLIKHHRATTRGG